MKNKTLFTRVGLALIVLLFAGCQTPTTPTASTPLPTAEATLAPQPTIEVLQPAIHPLVVEVCNGQAQAMAHALNIMEVTQSEEPLDDPISGASGTGCMATAVGSGVTFSSPDAVARALGSMLVEQGWTEDMMLQAGGPTGIGAGYRKAGEICLVGAIWQPADAANCPKDQPIMLCQLAPEQQLYTVTLNCGVEILEGQSTSDQQLPNPASENCSAQGGMLSIEELPDGSQYGICFFEDNRQCEEWALFNGVCPVGGVKVTGYVTPAAVFCAITGGLYTVTGGSNTDTEQGTCALPGSTVCDAWEYYNGECGGN